MLYRDELRLIPARIALAMDEPHDDALTGAESLLFCGCGTSYYLGAQCARLCAAHGRPARAVEAVDIIAGSFVPGKNDACVFISRSGNSEETVLAQQICGENAAFTFYIGCTPGSRLELLCDRARVMPYGREANILESYSSYVQMTAAMSCCGIALDGGLPETAELAIRLGERCYAEFGRGRNLSRIISLSAPFYRPLHREMMLKDGELTALPAEEWGALEFRHGPRCRCGEHTLIHFISGESTGTWDRNAARELISYGCPVIWYGEDAPSGSYGVSFGAARQSLEEAVACGVFHTVLAAELGRERGVSPEKLPHIVDNVGEL